MIHSDRKLHMQINNNKYDGETNISITRIQFFLKNNKTIYL